MVTERGCGWAGPVRQRDLRIEGCVIASAKDASPFSSPELFLQHIRRNADHHVKRFGAASTRTLSLQMHEALRQRIGTHYHLEGLTREELDAYLAQQLKAAGVTQPLFDDTARQGLYQATKGIPRKVNKLAMTALRLAADAQGARGWMKRCCWTPPPRRCYELSPTHHSVSARGRARADAQGRCDGAGSEEIGSTRPPAPDRRRGFVVFGFLALPFLWWSLGAEALGIQTRRSPEGRSNFFDLFGRLRK